LYYIQITDKNNKIVKNYTPLLDRLWLLDNNSMQKTVISNNWEWYLPKLPAKALLENKILPNLICPELSTVKGYYYNPCQASILTIHNKGYIVCQRFVNYTQTGASNFVSMDTDGIIRTQNSLCWLDENFKVIKQRPIENHYTGTIHNARVKGWEDLRIFFTQKSDCYIGATLSTWETRGNSVFMALIYLPLTKDEVYDFSPHNSGQPIKVTNLIPLDSPANAYCEKNWLPIYDRPGQWIYNYNPLTIINVNDTNGTVSVVEQRETALNISTWRSSAPPIPYNDGYLFSVHETSRLTNRINYYTRLVHVSKDFKLKALSTLFYFDHIGVEFSLSMAWDINNENLLILAGLEDAELQIYSVSPDTLYEILIPVEHYWYWVGSNNG